MNKKITISFVTNDGYAPYLSTAIYSLIANRNPNKQYALFVFFSSLSKKNIDLLSSLQTDNVTIHFVNFDEYTKDYNSLFYTWAHYTKESYYRLFIPKYFGENFGKIIYLDVDLVVNCDIGELLLETIGPHAVWGALNYSTPDDAEYIRSLGLSYLNYINAGVMVIDCKHFNQMGYFEKAAEIIAERRQFTYIDQDVLNLACNGDIGLIDPSWNLQWNNINHPERFMPEVRSSVKQIIQPRIVHFTIDKPWKRMLNRFGEYYNKYAAENPVYKAWFFELINYKNTR